MVDVYCALIVAKPQRKTFDQVPDRLKPQVEARLMEMGYDTNGNLVG